MDAQIQKLVKDKFASCTVLTIAHRLGTILDSDRVCVMAAGTIIVSYNSCFCLSQQFILTRLQEFGAPATLLENPCSHLSALMSKSTNSLRP